MAQQGFFSRTAAATIRAVLSLRFVRAALLYSEKRGSLLADSVTYRALFSVSAAAVLGFSLAALWFAGAPDAWNAVVATVDQTMPGLVKHGDSGILDLDNLPTSAGFSVTTIISAAALLWSSLGAIGSLRTSIRMIAGTVSDDLLWIWVILRNLGMAVGIAVSFVLGAVLTLVGQTGVEAVADFFGINGSSPLLGGAGRLISVGVVLLLDVLMIAAVFRVMSGVKARPRDLWTGALIGGIGLVLLQELSSFVVRGASSNPLLATFASLLAFLIWMNFSLQVILLSCAYIVTATEERTGGRRATTFAQRRLLQAERDVEIATRTLRTAQEAEEEERRG